MIWRVGARLPPVLYPLKIPAIRHAEGRGSASRSLMMGLFCPPPFRESCVAFRDLLDTMGHVIVRSFGRAFELRRASPLKRASPQWRRASPARITMRIVSWAKCIATRWRRVRLPWVMTFWLSLLSMFLVLMPQQRENISRLRCDETATPIKHG